MSSRKHWVRASTASALLGGALLALVALSQTATQRDCQQLTGADRQKCERRVGTPPEQTDPNSVNSTTRSAPSPATRDRTPAATSSSDQAHASSGKRQASKDADKQDPPQANDDDQEEEDAAPPPPDDQDDDQAAQPDDQDDEDEAPPPDTSSEADNPSDTQTPPQQR